MKRVVITLPHFIEDEATYINQLFESGIDLLHFRKPESSQDDCEKLLKTIPEKWYSRIVIHDHFELCTKYHLHGIISIAGTIKFQPTSQEASPVHAILWMKSEKP